MASKSVKQRAGRAWRPVVRITRVHTIIVGAGAAGMNCAAKLVEFWRAMSVRRPQDHLLVVTAGRSLGASRMSGSDKQTYYKMGTSPRVPDTAEDFAKTLTAFGCCHGDTALVEGIGSLRAFYHLVEAGVPFPHDSQGAFVGYKTDHDPYERATSAGPKTSRFMSECLEAKARRLGVRIVDRQPVLKLVTAGKGRGRRIAAMLCADLSDGRGRPAIRAYVADNWVLAAGGPGEIYRDTVYPPGQTGIHGAALETGLAACNLTESQYGLASIKFRWNVSGTYMQAVPRIFSTDSAGGDPREFLTEYFESMPQLALNIFLKGYQWPFDAQRIAAHQSSLIDMAVHQETAVRGRRVWMDFTRNPVGAEGWEAFDPQRLPGEAIDYLRKTGALQATPIERLEHMNAPAIDIYAEHGIDLRRQPLEIAVCAQHNNGGFAVNKWWESTIPHTFVIGEMAGTHGVKRPGGSALNAGQVGSLRAAQYIANVYSKAILRSPRAPRTASPSAALRGAIERAAAEAVRLCRQDSGQTPQQALAEIRDRMTRFGAHLRRLADAREALRSALAQFRRMLSEGLRVGSIRELPQAAAATQQCLTHAAMLAAICAVLDQGGGSRGSHCVLHESGTEMHPRLADPQTGAPYRFKSENADLRESILHVRYNLRAAALFEVWNERPRPAPDRQIAFEPAWAEFREGLIFGDREPPTTAH